MAGYLLEVNICLALVILFYKNGLQRLTFFTANRLYLIFGIVFCIAAPALRLPLLPQQWAAPSDTAARLMPEMVVMQPVSGNQVPPHRLSLSGILWAVYAGGAAWHLCKLFADLLAVGRLVGKYPARKLGKARLVFVGDAIPSSSFFHYIFINNQQLHSQTLRTCIAHELVHSRQAHTADWLLVRFLNAFCWFNPLMRSWREAITANHEFIADAHASGIAGRFRYSHLLVDLASSTQISALHYFSYYGQIKTRIIMLHQTPSKAVDRLRFLAAAPLAALMLFLVSCETPADRTSIAENLNKDLIGVWENMNRITMNENDGKTPRDFPERSGDVNVCLSKLELRADGRFEMHDNENLTSLSGTWQSSNAGDAVRLLCDNSKSGNAEISLKVSGTEGANVEMWQTYPANATLSAGRVFYEYKKL